MSTCLLLAASCTNRAFDTDLNFLVGSGLADSEWMGQAFSQSTTGGRIALTYLFS